MFIIFVEKCYYFINDAYFYFKFDWRNTENKTLGNLIIVGERVVSKHIRSLFPHCNGISLRFTLTIK